MRACFLCIVLASSPSHRTFHHISSLLHGMHLFDTCKGVGTLFWSDHISKYVLAPCPVCCMPCTAVQRNRICLCTEPEHLELL